MCDWEEQLLISVAALYRDYHRRGVPSADPPIATVSIGCSEREPRPQRILPAPPVEFCSNCPNRLACAVLWRASLPGAVDRYLQTERIGLRRYGYGCFP